MDEQLRRDITTPTDFGRYDGDPAKKVRFGGTGQISEGPRGVLEEEVLRYNSRESHRIRPSVVQFPGFQLGTDVAQQISSAIELTPADANDDGMDCKPKDKAWGVSEHKPYVS